MDRKILFLDMDGTLLTDRKEITPRNLEAIRAALSKGHSVVICSGRPLCSTLRLAHDLGLDAKGCYQIAYNGGVIYDAANVQALCTSVLTRRQLHTIFDIASRIPIHIHSYDAQGIVVDQANVDEELARYSGATNVGYRVVASVPDDLPTEPSKALAISLKNPDKLEALRTQIHSALNGQVDAFLSNPWYMEMVPHGVNKGEAVRQLCSHLGISTDNAIAVGDADNDIPMLQAVGLGVGMQNGNAAIKAIAGYITERDNNHDGVAEVIERFML